MNLHLLAKSIMQADVVAPEIVDNPVVVGVKWGVLVIAAEVAAVLGAK